jgi:hypothetical protein
MAAPLGFKTFNTGDVLSAADTNGYLMQGVLVFADAAARSAAITSPQEGQTSYLKDTDVIQVYSGSSWVTKSGGSSPLTTKGDLYTYSTTDARLPVGTNGHTLVADSAEATGLKWAAPGGASGLTLITRQTVTNAANTGSSFAGVFTSTYDTYLIVIENMSSPGTGQNVQMQLKYSTNTNQTSDYYGNNAYALFSASSFSFINTNNASAFNLTSAGNSADTRFTIWINGVGNTSERVTWSGNGFEGYNNRIHTFAGELVAENTYTGLNFLLASGNITITASVYGLAK